LDVFDAADTDHDGSVTRAEFDKALLTLGADAYDDLAGGSGSTRNGGSGRITPSLGMDSNPFKGANRSKGGSSSSGGSNEGGNSNGSGPSFDDPKSTSKFLKALFSSVSAILATEIGDKTFFIAAVLSMRNDRAAVFGGAILALIVMTILSTMMGLVLPSLLPRKYTHLFGGALFLYFGVKLLFDSRSMEAGAVSEELEEVEEELAERNKLAQKKSGMKRRGKNENAGSNDTDEDDVESGDAEEVTDSNCAPKQRRGAGKQRPPSSGGGLAAAGGYSGSTWESVFVQSLTMTFVAEWGDRSQIATIALAAAKDPLGVTIGGCIGHSMCTGMAVLGGRMLASRISEKTVAFYGGLVFLVFGFHSVFLEE